MASLIGRALSKRQVLPFVLVVLLLQSLPLVVSTSQKGRQGSRHIGRYVAQGLELDAGVPEDGYNASSAASNQGVATVTPSTSSTSSSISSAPSISANGTINSYALSCYSARYSYVQESKAWYSTAVLDKSFSQTAFITTQEFETATAATIYPTSVSTYKLCDGSPRVDASPVTLTSTFNWTSTFTTTLTPSSPTFVSAPCSMSKEDCQYLYSNTNLSSSEDVVLLGACGSPAHLGQPCLIGGGPVRLAYFPVSVIDGDLCKGNRTTITSMTGPTTIEALGTTLTSGSVYLSFQSLYAYQDGFNVRIGPNFTDFILALPSSAVSTQCGGWYSAQGEGTMVNWADFNYPQPASAYACENRCTTGLSYTNVNGTGYKYTPAPQCSTIWDDFNPALAVPTEARDLVAEWSTCSFWDAALPNFLFDPPIALRPADSIATATLPASGTGSTAVAASPAATSYTALAETESSMPQTTSASENAGDAVSSTGVQSEVQIKFTAGSQTLTASAATGEAAHNAFMVNGVTVPIGGSAQVVDGHTVSLGLSGFVVDGSTAVQIHSDSLGQAVATDTGSSSSQNAAESTSIKSSNTAHTTASPQSGSASDAQSTQTSKTGAATSGQATLAGWLLAPAIALLAMM